MVVLHSLCLCLFDKVLKAQPGVKLLSSMFCCSITTVNVMPCSQHTAAASVCGGKGGGGGGTSSPSAVILFTLALLPFASCLLGVLQPLAPAAPAACTALQLRAMQGCLLPPGLRPTEFCPRKTAERDDAHCEAGILLLSYLAGPFQAEESLHLQEALPATWAWLAVGPGEGEPAAICCGPSASGQCLTTRQQCRKLVKRHTNASSHVM